MRNLGRTESILYVFHKIVYLKIINFDDLYSLIGDTLPLDRLIGMERYLKIKIRIFDVLGD